METDAVSAASLFRALRSIGRSIEGRNASSSEAWRFCYAWSSSLVFRQRTFVLAWSGLHCLTGCFIFMVQSSRPG